MSNLSLQWYRSRGSAYANDKYGTIASVHAVRSNGKRLGYYHVYYADDEIQPRIFQTFEEAEAYVGSRFCLEMT